MVLWNDLSIFTGYCSVAVWVFAQIPQVVMHWRIESVDGLSVGFLLAWGLGDLASLFGTIVTHQLTFQKILCGYFCIIDIVLAFQYYLYKNNFDVVAGIDPGTVDNTNRSRKSSSSSSLKEAITSTVKFTGLASLLGSASAFDDTQAYTKVEPMYAWGAALSYAGAILYLISRWPQIYHNYSRKSTNGLSVLLFLSTIMGNLTYTLSIAFKALSFNTDGRADFIYNEMPFVLASAGTLLFDFMILGQWIYYDNATKHRRRYTEYMDRMIRPYFARARSTPVDTSPLLDATIDDYRGV